VTETTEQEGTWTCERCGAVRPASWTCSCGGEGKGERIVPEGWDPELTRTSRPRLGLIARPEPPAPPEPPDPSKLQAPSKLPDSPEPPGPGE
jgi:hypothetical protein